MNLTWRTQYILYLCFIIYLLGYVSGRDKIQGSIFIQEVCKEFNEKFFVLDISTMAANVNKQIMQGYGQIQAPVFENQLGNNVYFDAGNLNPKRKQNNPKKVIHKSNSNP